MFWSSCRYVMEMTFITLHVPANLSNNLDEFGSLLQWNGTKFLRLKFVSQDVEFSQNSNSVLRSPECQTGLLQRCVPLP